MQTGTSTPTAVARTELPSMLATLCSYECMFGPYHPQTLRLVVQVAIAYWQAGEDGYARPLLERAVRDLGRHLGADHDLRMRSIATLTELLVAQGDYEKAASAQRELLECQIRRLGSDHPDTLATRANLSTILLERMKVNTIPG